MDEPKPVQDNIDNPPPTPEASDEAGVVSPEAAVTDSSSETPDATANDAPTAGDNTPPVEPDKSDEEALDAESLDATPPPVSVATSQPAAADKTDSTQPGPDNKPIKKNHRNIVFAVVVASLVALLLIGIGYAAWLASRDDTSQPESSDTADEDTTVNEQDADTLGSDIDQLNSELEQLEQEVQESNLEDDNIGL